MKKLILLTILAFTAVTAFAQQPSNAAIEAAKHDKLMSILAAKSGVNGGNQITDLQPEQDCLGAIIVCQPTYFQPNSYTGAGNNPGEINNTTSCLGAGELNAVWYKIMVTGDGFLGFNLIPNDITNDYDWAVFNLTNAQCGDILNNATLEVSCNFSGSTFPTATTGPNGGPNAQDQPLIPVYSGEVYYICISNFSSTQAGYTLDFSPSTIPLGACSNIYGSIYLDLDNNCQLNPTDPPLPGQIVYMLPGPYYGISDANGLYNIGIPSGQTGTYQIFTQPYTPAVEQSCPLNPSYLTVQVNNTDSLYTGNNFAYIANDNVPCPALVVSNMSTWIRICCANTRYLSVNNMGSATSTNSQLQLTYMDNYIIPINFEVSGVSIPAVQNGNIYTINLPDLTVGSHINIHVTETVTNPSYDGFETCVLARALPDNTCGNTSNWDGSYTTVLANCTNNQTVDFTLQNVGAGDMANPAAFVVYNGINIVQSGSYQLQSGQTASYSFPANGDVYVIQANQTDDNPFGEQSSGYSNNCGSGFSPTASFNTFSQNYGGMATDMDCNLITNAVDPNDKAAVPAGIGPQHFISYADKIEYKIRFQNTGTAPADRVVIVDTLDANLDPATIILGASSHNYAAELSGAGVLTFTFNNINLPAEQDDEAGSMGAVTFSIGQRWGLPINYSINNKAYIYFDLNAPIITNNVFHNVKDNTTAITESTAGIILAELYPNPASNNFTIKLNALKTGQSYSMQLFTSTGAMVHEVGNIKTVENTVDVSTLVSGLYYYRVLTTDGKTAAGRFVKE